MISYQVIFYKGDYSERQRAANKDRCNLYIEHHFNSSANRDANYCVTIVGSNASRMSKEFGKAYSKRISLTFNCPIGGNDGIMVGGFGGRGDGNIRLTNMPAALLEPMFCSNPEQAETIRSSEGQDRLAKVLADTIMDFFPSGATIGFSIGHKYKRSNPNDRGAPVHGGGTEADCAEKVLFKTMGYLQP